MNKELQNSVEKRTFSIAVSLDKRAAEEQESRQISGYAAVFNSWSNPIWWFREKIDPKAFEKCNFDKCILNFNHDNEKIMARVSSGTLKLEVDDKGLRFSAELPNTTVGNDMLELIRRGDVNQCSFAFVVESDAWVYADNSNDLEFDERTILSIKEVYDVCPVVYPAYEDTTVDARSLENKKKEHFEQMKREGLEAIESEARKRELELLTLINK